MERHRIRRVSNFAQKILVVDHTAEPRQDPQVFIVAGRTDQKENIRQLATAAERDAAGMEFR